MGSAIDIRPLADMTLGCKEDISSIQNVGDGNREV